MNERTTTGKANATRGSERARRSAGPVCALGVLVIALLSAAGCASPNVNPPAARADTGYADLYCDPSDELWWDIQDLETHRTIFSELKPVEGGIVRLAFKPGHYKLGVAFLNCIVLEPATVELDIKDGSITPVRVTLVESGKATVSTTDTYRGSTIYGRYGRSTRIRASEDTMYRVNAEVKSTVPYALKSKTAYAESFSK